MAKIYISYKRQDEEIAKAIASELKKLGHEINIDLDILLPGEDWRASLMDALLNSDAVVVLLTEASLSSDYIISEIGAARAFMQTSKKLLLIPVLLDNIQIPPVVSDLLVLREPNRDIGKIVANISLALASFMGKKAEEEQKEAAIKKGIEDNAAPYIKTTLERLEKRESSNKAWGSVWYGLGFWLLL